MSDTVTDTPEHPKIASGRIGVVLGSGSHRWSGYEPPGPSNKHLPLQMSLVMRGLISGLSVFPGSACSWNTGLSRSPYVFSFIWIKCPQLPASSQTSLHCSLRLLCYIKVGSALWKLSPGNYWNCNFSLSSLHMSPPFRLLSFLFLF